MPTYQRKPIGLLFFCVWLALLPLPLGSNRPWALALTLPLLFLIGVVIAWRGATAAGHSLPATLIGFPGVWLGLFLLLLLGQALPLFGEPPASVVPARTWSFLLVALACATAFWLVLTLVRRGQDVRVLLLGLVGCGLVQAAIAAWLMGSGTTLTLLDNEIPATGVATGTFLNRNHLAGYLNMALAAGIGLLMGGLSTNPGERTWKQQLRDWLELMLSAKARLRLLLVLMVIVLITTRSRMGNASFFIGLLFAAAVYAAFVKSRRRGLLILVTSLVLVDLLLIGSWVGVDKVMERMQQTGLSRNAPMPGSGSDLPELTQADADTPGQTSPAPGGANPSVKSPSAVASEADQPAAEAPTPVSEQSVEERVDPALDAIGILRANPWLGTGGGTFYVAYMAHSLADHGYYNHAHNDYLEIASDTGLVGLGLLMALVVSSLVAAIRILRHRRNVNVRAAAFAALMAIACLVMHSIVDFNLQIPSNAVMFTVLVALPFAAARVRSGSSRKRYSALSADDDLTPGGDVVGAACATRSGTPLRWLMALATTLVLGWAGYTALRYGVADYAAIEAQAEMALWEQGERALDDDAITRVQSRLKAALSLMPENPDLHETLGNTWFARASLADEPDAADTRTGPQRQADLVAAADAYRAAIARNRASGYIWGNLLLTKIRLDQFDDEYVAALDNAARLGPYEPSVQAMVLEAGLAYWDKLPEASRRVVAQTVRRGWPTNRDRLAALARESVDAQRWCDLSPAAKPEVVSPPDIGGVMLALCRAADRLD